MASIKLREFQLSSVEACIKGLENPGGIFALADEVGLGKTFICSEVAKRFFECKKNKKNFVVFYIAPSKVLLDKNLCDIARYLREKLPKYKDNIEFTVTRLTTLKRDLANMVNYNKAGISIVGLTPKTSFRYSRSSFNERMFLAALLSYRKNKEFQQKCFRFFWGLKRPYDPSYDNYERTIRDFKGGVLSSGLVSLLSSHSISECVSIIIQSKLIRGKITEDQKKVFKKVQIEVANAVLKNLPEIILMDEWHKYKNECFKQKLVIDMLNNLRNKQSSKALFVSATPFSVKFSSSQNRVQCEDIKDYFKIVYGYASYDKFYEDFCFLQDEYIQAISSFLIGESTPTEVSRKKNGFEKCFKKLCSLTSRPKNLVPENPPYGEWNSSVVDSLCEVAEKYNKGKFPRTPVDKMWLDGNWFPDWSYSGLKKTDRKKLKGEHWKIKSLRQNLHSSFNLEGKDTLHSHVRPPLWLSPSNGYDRKKYLIFTSFNFLPNEICKEMDKKNGFGFASKHSSKSHAGIGVFPFSNRNISAEKVIGDHNFLMFYPFKFYLLVAKEIEEILKEKKNEFEELFLNASHAYDLINGIEALFDNDHREDDVYTIGCLDLINIPLGIRITEFVRFILDIKHLESVPGYLICKGIDAIDETRNSAQKFEKKIQLCDSVMRLFNSKESNVLMKDAAFSRQKGVNKFWSKPLRFSIWYVKRFNLRETLADYVDVLQKCGFDDLKSLEEINLSLHIGHSLKGNRYIKSFADRDFDSGATTNQKRSRLANEKAKKGIQTAFNSPFPPYVLVTTSIAQEGLDFHRYCNTIIHWSPPVSPAELKQREGRLDRFQSLQVRLARAKVSQQGKVEEEWRGISPDFAVMVENRRFNKLNRIVFRLPWTYQDFVWKRCLERLFFNDILLGTPDALSNEKLINLGLELLTDDERKVKLEELAKYTIDLSPS